MKTIFYTNSERYSSEIALKLLLMKFYGMDNPTILRAKNGKPYVENGPHFSITHTKDKLFIVFSERPIGIDAESLSRNVDFTPILKKFPTQERENITTLQDFLKHWVIKESAIKYLGTTLAQSLQKLTFANNRLYYQEKELSCIPQIFEFENHLVCICAEESFEKATFLQIP